MSKSSRERQQALFAAFAQVAEGLAHGNRLALLELLAQGERDVEGLARSTGLAVASVSQHLQRLKRAGLVAARREGRRQIYRLSSPRVSQLVSTLERMAEECVLEVDKLVDDALRSREQRPPLSGDELNELLASDAVTLLDVRPELEFRAGHIPGAMNIPVNELARRLDELPRDREVIVYCRGPYCVLTLDALEALSEAGFTVRRLADGVADWARAGQPVEHDPVEHDNGPQVA